MQQQPPLTSSERAKILGLLERAPVTELSYHASLHDERVGNENTLRTAIVKRGGRFEVWFDDTTLDPTYEGAFSTVAAAQEAEQKLVNMAMGQIISFLDAERDEEWTKRPLCPVKWKYPMVFTDATDYRYGWDLQDKADLLDFLISFRAHIFEPDEPGSLYWWSLQDANGIHCRPVRSHRGEIRLEEAINEIPE